MHFKEQAEVDRTYRKAFERPDIGEQDIKNVVLAGLMHDLGHGVCSHLFDRDLMPILL